MKHGFPRIVFYEDFRKWANWGSELMNLHINYEEVEAFNLIREDSDIKKNERAEQKKIFAEPLEGEAMFARVPKLKVKLKRNKTREEVVIDEITTLKGFPSIAWEYKVGNRSALEWILDQYKEKKPRDKTVMEKFNDYQFADYKEHVIDLLKRICTVSVRTMEIINEMKKETVS